MEINTLYNELFEAYSSDNLNRITTKIILLYKKKKHSKIREIANVVSRYVDIHEDNDAKCFSKLILLYHPDKGEHIKSNMKNLYEQNNIEELRNYSHIFLLDDIDNITANVIDKEVEYNPEFSWDVHSQDGYAFTDSYGDEDYEEGYETEDYERSFFNMIKIREYGKLDIELPTYYLEDYEEFEMAYSGLEVLDGVEYCKHVKILDVSNNEISDLENLWNLTFLEELYLSNNKIGYIDALSNLINLKIIDLSFNEIDDLTPILDLENLEYVNLMGNKIPAEQIKFLENKEVLVTI